MSAVKGYRTLTQREIDLMNRVKSAAAEMGELIDELADMPEIDQRWLELGKSHLQVGTMQVVRAIEEPDSF